MILELDAGNSRIKWRIIDCDGVRVQSGTFDSFAALADFEPGQAMERVRVASVASNENEAILVAATRDGLGIEPELARTKAVYEGLRIAYADPQRLGVDRWLAMLAARACSPAPACIIDLGSAVTIDLVDAGGQHLGGYIVPGFRMQRQVLLRDTGQIRLEEEVLAQASGWGNSTEQAVYHGISRMLTSLIDSVFAELGKSMSGTEVYFTGGDVALLDYSLVPGLNFTRVPDLVLDGLAVALP